MKWLFLEVLLKITSSLCKMKSKVTIGVKNTAHYTHLLYILLTDENIQHNSLWFISDDNNHDTNFVYKIQTMLVDYLKENLPIVIDIFCFSDGCTELCKNHKNFFNLCHHWQNFNMDAEWIFFATNHGKSPCDSVTGFVKHDVAKCSLQRPLHDQILS